MTANSIWNIENFRAGLIKGLADHGMNIVVAAPGAGDGGGRAEIAVDRSGMNPVRDLALLWSYWRLLRRLRPDAFLSFTVKPNIYGAIAARLAGTPAIPNVSGLGTAFISGEGLGLVVERLARLAFRRCPVVFFQNPDDRAFFVERRIVTTGQARLLPGSGIDLDRFSPAGGDEPGELVFLMIARLIGDKGVREYVEAARRVKERLPDVRFQLLGPLDEGNRTAISTAELDRWIGQGVEYRGETDDVRPFVAAASVLVLPSYREGLPRTLLEGAAMAKPLIATDVPGCRDLIAEGVNGYLCVARDSGSLADAITRMAELDAGRRAEMGRASRAMAERRFSETIVIDAYLDALRALPGFSRDRT